MMEDINKDIESNLDLIFDSKDQFLHQSQFVSGSDISIREIISVMEDKYLIEESDSDIYVLTEQGYKIVEEGGWQYLIDQSDTPKPSHNLLEKIQVEYDKVVEKSNTSKKFYQNVKFSTYMYLLVLAFFAGLYQYNNKVSEQESKNKDVPLVEIRDTLN